MPRRIKPATLKGRGARRARPAPFTTRAGYGPSWTSDCGFCGQARAQHP